MMATERKPFVPNAVFIPEDAVSSHDHVEYDDCTPLYIDGDRTMADVFTQEAWENGGEPSYVLRHDKYYVVGENGEQTFLCTSGLGIKDKKGIEGESIVLLPKMAVLKIDETEHFEELVKEYQIERVFGVYFVNLARFVYNCSTTPDYELYFYEYQYERSEALQARITKDIEEGDDTLRDEIDEAIREAVDSDQHTYFQVSYVESLLETKIGVEGDFPPKGKNGGYVAEGLEAVTEEDAIDALYDQSNNGDL